MEDKNTPIVKHLVDYLDWLELERGLSQNSQKNYANFLKSFFEFLKTSNLEDLKPNELTPDHIWKYRVYLSRLSKKNFEISLKRSTQNHYLVALRSLLTYFLKRDIPSLAPDKVDIPKDTEEKKVHFLNLEQIEKLLQVPDITTLIGLRDRAILETLFSTGLRIAELVALNKEQVVTKEKVSNLEIVILGKGNRTRPVYISDRAFEWVDRYLQSREDDEKALFINYAGRNPLSRLTARSIERNVKHYALLGGLPVTTTCHTLRHSFATDLLSKGADLRTVQEFLGHKNVATTQIYTHITKPHLREVHRSLHGMKSGVDKTS